MSQSFSFGTHRRWRQHHLPDLMREHRSVCTGSWCICQISFMNWESAKTKGNKGSARPRFMRINDVTKRHLSRLRGTRLIHPHPARIHSIFPRSTQFSFLPKAVCAVHPWPQHNAPEGGNRATQGTTQLYLEHFLSPHLLLPASPHSCHSLDLSCHSLDLPSPVSKSSFVGHIAQFWSRTGSPIDSDNVEQGSAPLSSHDSVPVLSGDHWK